ncbi:MAG: DUF2442 domain-containing protein [Bacteroidaceae bacterium]|jgi:hypothetical protein|nr:DUF2442 domain-containing protein [Bacteroidaceae bacterium]
MIAVKKIWITDSAVWIKTADGREACEKFSDYPRLRYATQQQREKYTADAFGIRWEEIDEDLSYEGFFRSKPTNTLYDLFMSHPEINASAVARRLGMAQSLLAQYISGAKKPSNERLELIKSEIRKIGKELSSIQ